MKTTNFTRAVLLAGAVLASPAALSMEKGDWLFRAGMTVIDPKSENSRVVEVDSDSSFTFNFTYLFHENWAIDLLAAYPFKHDIYLAGGERVATAEHLPPTLSLQYRMLPEANFQPYFGLGINYTNFFDEETYGALEGTTLKLDDSWGWAVQAGFDYMINEKWFWNVDLRWMDIESDATLDGASLGTVEIDPFLYGFNVGFRF